MPRQLPIKALLAFEAVMKHKSFRLAAAGLHVTPGAVGQQIQRLEEWLGSRLFIRTIRQIHPTPEATKYWLTIEPALARIRQASEDLRLSQSNEVWLSMPPTLAAKWFAPRMARFMTSHPDISLHLGASTALVNFELERIDLSIRHFDGNDRDLQADLLYPGEARVYCSPAYARKHRLRKPDDLACATLLHTTLLPHWKEWLQTFSCLTAPQVDAIAGQHFDQSMLAIETARHGQGVVLSSPMLVEADVREGCLCEPFDLPLALPKAYYLVHHRQVPLRPAAQVLKQWLIDTVAQETGIR